MRVMTVRQPWAWAIIHGGKDVENRVRNIAGAYRGPVAIHVAQTWDGECWDKPLVCAAHVEARSSDGLSLPEREWGVMDPQRGHIIGVVDLVAVHSPHPGEGAFRGDTCSPWAEPDSHHLELANPRPLTELIPFRGSLGLRSLPPDVVAGIARIGFTIPEAPSAHAGGASTVSKEGT